MSHTIVRESLKQMALTIELPNGSRPSFAARRLAFGIVLGQAGVTLLAALVSFVVGGSKGAVSALLGGGIGTAASLAMAAIAFGRTPRSALMILAAFFLGELVKLLLMIGLFVAAWHFMRPSPGAMFAAYGATFLVYWVALGGMLRRPVVLPRPLGEAQG
ncbi:MAG: ATP synthase subunit I [Steroidobacteraceae bacterium]